jgi:phosphatidylglycerol:prolipoprotein diacylglycerol transferase
MEIYPLRFNLGPLEITGFGLMMMLAFLTAGWVMERDLRSRGMSDEYAWSIIFVGAIGGILGAKLWYAGLHQSWDALFSRAGLVWYGGFFGAVTAILVNSGRLRVPLRFTADLCAPALAVGYTLGRIGCFLVQDDYGGPSNLPWAMRFPQGEPPSTAQNLMAFGVEVPPGTSPFEVLAVHPTQLYEALTLLVAFWIMWRIRNHRHAVGWLWGVYMIIAGTERFLVEFLRAKDDRLLGSFTLAQGASAIVVVIGVALLLIWHKDDGRARDLDAPILKTSGG